jgi:hypothetical protein
MKNYVRENPIVNNLSIKKAPKNFGAFHKHFVTFIYRLSLLQSQHQ